MRQRKSKEIHNDRMLIERFMARVPGLNRFRLAFVDLLASCDAYGIVVIQQPMRVLHGSAIHSSTRPYIMINSHLSGPEKVIAGFHEFTHIIDQEVPENSYRLSTGNLYNMSKSERQAQVVGVIALMPGPEARGLTVEDMMRIYGVRREVAEFRVTLKL